MNKVIALSEAVALLRSGETLALGGMNLYRKPVAFVREVIRQRIGKLTLVSLAASYESDLLVGAGLISAVRTCYFGLEGFGLAPMFTALAGKGGVRVIEESEASLAYGLRAAAAGVGFMPGQGWLGTDCLRVRPDVKLVTDPYSGEQVVAFPAIRPDVAVIHAREADHWGNAAFVGNRALDWQLAFAAEKVVVTAERVVARLDRLADVPGVRVSAVVEAPRGAWPTSCYPEYPLDGREILRYVEMCQAGRFENYLREFLERNP
ncbi:MAG: CoA transferase subunit A [Chloroflexi bacterium]|nr:CoA transferase subunit A [Chloroflexota bacterium]